MKGGGRLGTNCKELGIKNHLFADEKSRNDDIENLRLFTFGTTLQKDAWLSLLRLCNTKNIPVYILTSGNKIGIIVTLQLAGLQQYFEDVLCVRDDLNVNPLNPSNPDHHAFHGKTKYEVIAQIMTENRLSCHGERIGYFLDDDAVNSVNSDLCRSIEFRNVNNPSGKPSDFNLAQIHDNPFYKLSVEDLKLKPISEQEGDYNFTPIQIIEEMTGEVNAGRARILFLDFDKTFQKWPGAIPFHIRGIETFFEQRGLNYKFSRY
jgi:hypothetical protein